MQTNVMLTELSHISRYCHTKHTSLPIFIEQIANATEEYERFQNAEFEEHDGHSTFAGGSPPAAPFRTDERVIM